MHTDKTLDKELRITLILALLGWLTFFTAIPAIIRARRLVKDLRTDGKQLERYPKLLASIAMSVAVIILGMGIALWSLSVIAIGRITSGEMAVVKTLRELHEGLGVYARVQGSYPLSLSQLHEAGAIRFQPSRVMHGYEIVYEVEARRPTDSSILPGRYTLRAIPRWKCVDGVNSFFVDQTGVLRIEKGAPATRESQPIAINPPRSRRASRREKRFAGAARILGGRDERLGCRGRVALRLRSGSDEREWQEGNNAWRDDVSSFGGSCTRRPSSDNRDHSHRTGGPAN